MRKLINEQRRMTIGSEEYQQQFKKIARLKAISDQHQADLRNMGKSWATIATEKINKYWGVVAGGVASLAGVAIAYRRAAEAADRFEERIDSLSALTGLQGQDLDWLARTAQDTSVKITEGNVRIKQSADDIADAYTKVGSQRPELLKNKEALAAVTEDAIILSEAAKSDLEPAVKGLTTTLNQFNLPASESRRVINAMAAGSKEGAADIPYLTDAIEKTGTTMKLMNVSLEENIGLIEAIAPNYAQASMAGNSLDKVFLRLKEKQIGYVNGAFNLNAALDELARRYSNGETAASLFGVEHAKMGELLVLNRAKVTEYTRAVTGTNTAIEQAARNTDNAKAIQAQANNAFHNAAIEIGKNLSPAMTTLYKVAGSVATAFTRMIAASPASSLREEQTELNLLVSSIMNANNSQETRNKFIAALQDKYPDFLGNLDAEKLTNEQLRDRLREVNKEYENKILLAIKEDTLKTNYQQRIGLTLQEMDAIKQMAKYEELANQARKKAADEKDPLKLRTLLSNEEITALNAMDLLPRKLEKIRGQFQELLDEEATLNDAITELRSKLNIPDAEQETEPVNPSVSGANAPKRDVEALGMMETIDPRIESENAVTEAIIESSKLRQRALDAEEAAARMRIESEIQLQQRKKEAYLSSLDTIISVFGEETKIGKAALIAKQAYAIAETIINIAKGTGETAASVPFPFNIPLIIGFAAQVAALITTIKSATSKVSGYATGGFTNGDRIYRAGEAGQEWIAPNGMLSNPVTGPVIQWLEYFRRKPYTVNPGVIEAVSPSVRMPAPQPSGSAIIQTNSPQIVVQSDPRLTDLLNKLDRKLEEGIKAKATINKFGINSLDEALEEVKNFNSKVNKS
ncbi:MAG: phage tail tape measure protein [Mangrovibacterium sp.]